MAARRSDRSHAEDKRRDGYERVGRVEIAAEQEPRDHGPEAPAAQAPLFEVVGFARRQRTVAKPSPLTARTGRRRRPARSRRFVRLGDDRAECAHRRLVAR